MSTYTGLENSIDALITEGKFDTLDAIFNHYQGIYRPFDRDSIDTKELEKIIKIKKKKYDQETD